MSSTSTLTGRQAPPVLFVAPHRAMFLAGAVQLLVVFALWAVELAARAGIGAAHSWPLPPAWMHAMLVLGGVFPFFMFGFLCTAMPRWQGYGDLSPAAWLWSWRFLVAGWTAILVGMWLPVLIAPGLGAVILGWVKVARVLWKVAHGPHPDRVHARLTWWGIAGGAASMVAWLGYVLRGEPLCARAAIELGLWAFLLPVFFTVCHRMVPFFSSNIIAQYTMVRPRWALAAVIGGGLLHGLLAGVGLDAWTWVGDVAVAATALWLSWNWRLRASLAVPLLGMLHIGFAWLGVAMSLFAIQSLGLLLGWHGLGLAPLHALGVGFFSSILFAMVSRVTLGHSGRALAADRLTWHLFLALQVVAVTRVAAEFVPVSLAPAVLVAAVLGWLSVFSTWAVRYLPLYWRPRADGRPG